MEDGDAAEPPQAVTEARTSGSRLPEPAAAPVPGRPRNMVVLGASAGGVEALRRVVSGLPPDLPAAVCVVLHIAPGGPSALAGILGRCGPLPCRAVRGRERLREGEILVAPPDRHIMIESGQVVLSSGPRENGHRPSIDALFRTAAASLEGRVIGVVLSGTRDDGTAGLAAIKARGGFTVVQDPEEAMYGGMPMNAISHVAVDTVVSAGDIGGTITRMIDGTFGASTAGEPRAEPVDPPGEPVITTCPDCGGVLSEHRRAGVTQWQCRVGHRYSPASLADAQAAGVEAKVWAAVRALEDRRGLLERIARDSELRGALASAQVFRERAEQAGAQAQAVRDMLARSLGGTLRAVEDEPGDDAPAERRRPPA